jgi:hypothetical protein
MNQFNHINKLIDINEEIEDSINNLEIKEDGMEFNSDSIKN